MPVNRDRLVLEHLPYATQLAKRYAGRGQSLEDLVQVASLGLVHAADRFDPEHGSEFYAFATPTILGELRRHFRDHAWAVRVPRSLQETTMRVQRVAEERAAAGLPSGASDIAADLGLVEEEVIAARQAHLEARATQSLDLPIGERGDEYVADIVGDLDPNFDHVETAGAVREALVALPPRERDIVLLRYYGERTQPEIADILGISQVQVSRLLSRTLAAIRDHILYDEPLPVRGRTA
jgi:RNA polymerase sigma-B factor